MNARICLLSPVLVALAQPLAVDGEVRFAPEVGTEFALDYTKTTSLELVSHGMTVTVDGEERDQEAPDIKVKLESSLGSTMRDEILAVEDGRVTRLKRTFEEITQSREQSVETPDGDESRESEGESALEGLAVVFSWDGDSDEYAVEFYEDDEGDEELLEKLEFDAHLACMLPDEDVAEGDSWEVDIDAFRLINNPGGDSSVVMEDEGDGREEERAQFDENLSGTITCTLGEETELDGVRVVLIEVVVEAETFSETGDEREFPQGTMTLSERNEFRFALEGTLTWNLDAARAAALSLGGELTVDVNRTQIGEGEMSLEANRTQRFEGETQFELAVSE